MILGHNHPEVIKAVHEAVDMGLTFGCATQREILIAEEIKKLIPSIEEVRLVSSGTRSRNERYSSGPRFYCTK